MLDEAQVEPGEGEKGESGGESKEKKGRDWRVGGLRGMALLEEPGDETSA